MNWLKNQHVSHQLKEDLFEDKNPLDFYINGPCRDIPCQFNLDFEDVFYKLITKNVNEQDRKAWASLFHFKISKIASIKEEEKRKELFSTTVEELVILYKLCSLTDVQMDKLKKHHLESAENMINYIIRVALANSSTSTWGKMKMVLLT